MGLTIVVRDPDGADLSTPVVDERNLLDDLLPQDDVSYPYLSFVDPYGDTVFNRPQMKPFLMEWRRLAAQAGSPALISLFERVEALASMCEREVHTYLVFVGD